MDSSPVRKAVTMFVSRRNLPYIHVYLFAACLDGATHRLAFVGMNATNMFQESVNRHAWTKPLKRTHILKNAALGVGCQFADFRVYLGWKVGSHGFSLHEGRGGANSEYESTLAKACAANRIS